MTPTKPGQINYGGTPAETDAKEKAKERLAPTAGSRSSDTPYSDIHCWYYDASQAETRARREMTGYHVRLSAAQEMERRLNVIAADAACVNDEWLVQQGEGIRAIIANIRRHANLSENDQVEARRP